MEKRAEKRIEVVELTASELKDRLGNPRKCSRKKREELKHSLEMFGDFGIIVVDHENNIISGHQRIAAMIASGNGDDKVLCKRLIGYTNAELKAINIKANTHAGDWDLGKLAEWTADLNLNLGLDLPAKDPNEDVKIRDMELIGYEGYDFVMIVCKTEPDYLKLIRDLGLEGKKVLMCNKKNGERKIKARAIWYNDLEITPKAKSK
ncbi:MAG: hypothetical protein HDS62_08445 [Bacteroidales bacterium]|nr:hypothetical protein [Bacteroidales bacterium]